MIPEGAGFACRRGRADRLCRNGLLVLLLLALLALVATGPEPGHALRYERAGVQSGELWRLFTAGLVHLGWAHALLNGAGLVLTWWLCVPALAPLRAGLALFVSSLGVGLGLLGLNPEVQWYVGLSGALHGLFAAGALALLRARAPGGAVLLALLALKLAWEQQRGGDPALAALVGGAVIVDAHLYGAVAGALTEALAHARTGRRRRTG